MNQIFFTADLHLGHDTVAQHRGFPNAPAHDNHILSQLATTLGKRDTLYILGDVTDNADWEYGLHCLTPIRSLTGAELHLIAGNHDPVHPMHRNWKKHVDEYLRVFSTVTTADTTRAMGRRCLVSHFPYEGDHSTPDRYTQWRLPDEGAPIIHGHTHATQSLSHTKSGTPQICVSVDAHNYRPVPKGRIDKLLASHA
ncbi:Calcineurin-like phosphoesterase superfamily domain protein [Corynebacterium ciconiae DSM 44920]|uniref:metallophosphoesterase family protein n=1 Tax=Corynebacterium ciconiae TaxID=227319 RepID=UPI00037598D7|nr:metallophosphoesterase [Corynebacterium ciconiae]WKD60905.1 Calcineurin-like phosphoesterase superfamily domain protein [Corynebacterium ciconiae DSM 44920]